MFNMDVSSSMEKPSMFSFLYRQSSHGTTQIHVHSAWPEGKFARLHDDDDPPSPPRRPRRPLRPRRRGLLATTWLLWRFAFPQPEYSHALVGLAAGMTIYAQWTVTLLPDAFSEVTRELTTQRGDHAAKQARVIDLCTITLLRLVVYIALRALAQLLMKLVGANWRAALTKRMHALYLDGNAHYKLRFLGCDNPEQRISSDLNTYIKLSCGGVSPPLQSLYLGLVADLFLICWSFVYVITRIRMERAVEYSCLYNFITIGMAVALAIPIAGFTAKQEELEGEFRQAHWQLHDHAEQIAMINGEQVELKQLSQRVQQLAANTQKIILKYYQLNLVSSSRSIGGPFVALLVVTTFVFSGVFDFFEVGALSQGIAVFNLVSESFQGLPDKLAMLTTVVGLGDRVTDLLDRLVELQSAPPPKVVVEETPFSIAVTNLRLSTPDGKRQLFDGLTFRIGEHESLVLRGESACGKSSVVRCLMGLWEADCGELSRPRLGRGGVVCLPQRPYIAVGSLRQQVCYPDAEPIGDSETDRHIEELLHSVDLSAVLATYSLDSVVQWQDVLSVGEQQRLSIARLLFRQPKFAILDEATSALDLAMEATCMGLISDAGIGMLTIAHRPSVVRFHQQMVLVNSDGSFVWTPLASVTPC
ncbi:hypothetical protein AB1Y20_016540 [Prymnesium parvum]|uniref:ABC transporter domain-containing protein n=1 Tax=Prymnesium parvum TaxID=97485 RepID=A0AB34IBX3_PRYPA